MEIVIFVLGLALGLTLGFILTKYRNKKSEEVGTLRVDRSDSDGPYLFLELHTDVEEVMRRKKVTFGVNVENYISQE